MSKFLILFSLLFAIAAPARADVLGPNLTFNANTGRVYSQKNAFDRWYPASITKMMTAYVALKQIKSGKLTFKSPVRISEYALSKPPSKMGFPVGTVLNLESALKIILVKSANDIATAIAESVGGSEEAFVGMMNQYARSIGMKSSNFMNPHGLHDPNQYVTAYDMGILARQIYKEFPKEAELFSIHAIKVGKRTLRNHNALMRRFPGTIGMKTGFICSGGLNIVTAVKVNNQIIVSVVLGGTSGRERNLLAAELLTEAKKKRFEFNPTKIDKLKRPSTVAAPIDIRDYVCGRKKGQSLEGESEEEGADTEATEVVSIADREALVMTEGKQPVTVVQVGLNNATGPDPFELLVEKPPLELVEEFKDVAGVLEPATRYEIGGKFKVPVPTSRPVIQ